VNPTVCKILKKLVQKKLINQKIKGSSFLVFVEDILNDRQAYLF
jgi:hypothetical protein